MDFSYTKNFTINAIEWSFRAMIRNLWCFMLVFGLWAVALFGVILALAALLWALAYFAKDSGVFLYIIGGIMVSFMTLFCSLIAGWFRAGLTVMSLKIYNQNECSVIDSVPQFFLAVKMVIASVLYALGAGIGFFFFIIPGLFFMVRFALYQQYLVDHNCGIIESFSRSFQITKGKNGSALCGLMITWFLTWFGTVGLLKIFLGASGIIIGHVFTLLLSVLLYTHAYKILENNPV